ncbi:hypothetical protein GQ473_05050 [archaeon]|nr:hypothetical protein [archaeon]
MKKAVSPLIAVILLIVFTVAVSTAILGWLTDYTKTTTEAASSGTSGTQGVVNCANQMISISDVSITQNSDIVTQFNDSDTSKTFSSATGDTFTTYIRIPKNATVTSTALTITGQAYE